MTRAPRYLPRTSAVTPTPEGIAVTSKVSPARNCPLTKRPSCTTTKTTGMQAASSQDRLAGAGMISRVQQRVFGEAAGAAAHRTVARLEAGDPLLGSGLSRLGAELVQTAEFGAVDRGGIYPQQ